MNSRRKANGWRTTMSNRTQTAFDRRPNACGWRGRRNGDSNDRPLKSEYSSTTSECRCILLNYLIVCFFSVFSFFSFESSTLSGSLSYAPLALNPADVSIMFLYHLCAVSLIWSGSLVDFFLSSVELWSHLDPL
jgi:hypothetical protein